MASLLKGTIYRLYSESEGKEYLGSTKRKLSLRLSLHKSKYKRWLEDKNEDYCGSFEILKTEDYTIECLEEVEVESKEELRQIERQWYDKRIEEIGRDRVVNKIRPYATEVEIKEWDLQHKKEYRKRNKEKLSKCDKERRERNKDKISEYRENNKDKVSLINSQKIYCKYCDSEMRKDSVSHHNKSTKHITNFILF